MTVFDTPAPDRTKASTSQPVRWSNLKYILRSPAHYAHAITHPFVTTKAVRIGALAHKKVLHGAGAFAVWRGGRRAGADWKAFESDHYGVEILTAPEAEIVDGVVASIRSHPRAMQLLTGGETEQRRTWRIADRECCGTPDCVGPEWLADLKVTADASPERFPWHARKMGWLAQADWYAEGVDPDVPLPCWIVAVEVKPPYPIVLYPLTMLALEQGHKTWRVAFERLLVCEASGVWPGYSDAPVPLDGSDDDFALTVGGEEIEL